MSTENTSSKTEFKDFSFPGSQLNFGELIGEWDPNSAKVEKQFAASELNMEHVQKQRQGR